MKTKTPILAVTKAFFILLVMCCFSCNRTEMTYTVEEINLLNKYKATYTMTVRNQYGILLHRHDSIDSINKFHIGDSIQLIK